MLDQSTEYNSFTQGTVMVRDSFATDTPQLQDVLDSLDDPACRAIIEQLEEPMTASELSEACDIPLSTTYRKLELLSNASLLEERIEVRTDNQNTTRYAIAFDEVRIGLDNDRSIEVAIKHRQRTPDQRLSALWSEVSKET
jgi:DNA-binding transcriptional ArsR family regulator